MIAAEGRKPATKAQRALFAVAPRKRIPNNPRMPSVAYLKDAPQTMTKSELAKFMRLNRKTVERMTIRPGNERGWIPCDRAGNRCRYDKTLVEQAILRRAF